MEVKETYYKEAYYNWQPDYAVGRLAIYLLYFTFNFIYFTTVSAIPEHNVGRHAKKGALESLKAPWHELNDEFVGSGFTFSLLGVAGAGTRRPARLRVRGARALDTSVSQVTNTGLLSVDLHCGQ